MDCGLCVCLLIFPFSSYSRRSREHLLILGEQHDCICSKLCVHFRWVERNCILENLEMEILYLGMIYGDTVHFLFHSENSPQMCLSETWGSCRGSSTLNWRSDAHVHTEGCTARSLEETAFPLQAPGDFHPMEQGTAATSRGQETPQKLRTFTGAFFYTIFAFPCFNLYFLSRFHSPLCKATHTSFALFSSCKMMSCFPAVAPGRSFWDTFNLHVHTQDQTGCVLLHSSTLKTLISFYKWLMQ